MKCPFGFQELYRKYLMKRIVQERRNGMAVITRYCFGYSVVCVLMMSQFHVICPFPLNLYAAYCWTGIVHDDIKFQNG
jgi:hypothetical protein